MAVVAITPIQHGEGKDTKTFKVGDDVSGLDKDAVRQLVEAGAAIDTSEKNPMAAAVAARSADDDTRKRDEIIAKYMFGNDAVKEGEPIRLPDTMEAGVPAPVDQAGDTASAKKSADK